MNFKIDVNKRYTVINNDFEAILNKEEIDKIYNNKMHYVIGNLWNRSQDTTKYLHGLLVNKESNYAVEITWTLDGEVVISSIPRYLKAIVLTEITDADELEKRLKVMLRLNYKKE